MVVTELQIESDCREITSVELLDQTKTEMKKKELIVPTKFSF
ncbi:hypothetical protein J2S78_002537 [Salibacterium salarium]|nr:hypothetical protein [Salibacterium salarium]